jgi:acyl-coenzyme A synthetase/AMP-(fatty) acid ligase
MGACTSLRHVLVGGEALPPALAARFADRLPHAHLHNAYGPTETTVDATGASKRMVIKKDAFTCLGSLTLGLCAALPARL